MKKPPKRKPQRKTRKTAQAAAAPKAVATHAAASKSNPTKIKPTKSKTKQAKGKPASQPTQHVIRLAPLPGRPAATSQRARAAAYSADDHSALALLLLPFLIVATSLALSQAWRTSLPLVTEIARPVASERPIDVARIAPPPLTPPGTLAYPTAPPPIDVASLDVRPSTIRPGAPLPAPAVDLPGPAPGYPTAAPAIDPHVAVAAVPQASPADVAHWSPAPPAWHDRLAAPPTDLEPQMCAPDAATLASFGAIGRTARVPRVATITSRDRAAIGLRIAQAARAQTQDLVIYSARYKPMAYPLGDVSQLYGACTDVIIRAYRTIGLDLQELVQRTHVGRGDTSIDHRRTETLRTFFTRAGASLPITAFPEDYKPGDIVTYHRPFSRVSSSHIAIVSDVLAPTGRPMIVHNRGWGPQLEDALFVDRITGHYRYTGTDAPAPAVSDAAPARRQLVKASYPASAAPGATLKRLARVNDAQAAAGSVNAAPVPSSQPAAKPR